MIHKHKNIQKQLIIIFCLFFSLFIKDTALAKNYYFKSGGAVMTNYDSWADKESSSVSSPYVIQKHNVSSRSKQYSYDYDYYIKDDYGDGEYSKYYVGAASGTLSSGTGVGAASWYGVSDGCYDRWSDSKYYTKNIDLDVLWPSLTQSSNVTKTRKYVDEGDSDTESTTDYLSMQTAVYKSFPTSVSVTCGNSVTVSFTRSMGRAYDDGTFSPQDSITSGVWAKKEDGDVDMGWNYTNNLSVKWYLNKLDGKGFQLMATNQSTSYTFTPTGNWQVYAISSSTNYPATQTATCTVSLTHNYTAYAQISNNYTNHNVKCKTCGLVKGTEAHTAIGSISGGQGCTKCLYPAYYFDLNGWLDGASSGSLGSHGKANLTITGNPSATKTGITDYYTAHYKGSTYSISGITANSGYNYAGVYSGATSGTISAATSTFLKFNKNTYTIVYNKNASDATGTMANTTGTYNTAVTLRANAFSRTGYSFNGWNTAANGSGTSYANQASVTNLSTTNGATVNLYAKWTANNYPVTYNIHDTAQNRVIKTFTLQKAYGTTAKGTDIDSQLGADSEGVFYVSGDAKPYKLLTDGTIETTATVKTSGTTVIRYCRLNEITVTFDLNKPIAATSTPTCDTTSKIVVPLAQYGTLPEADMTDWTFTGWYTTQSGGTKVTSTSLVNYTEDFTLYAQWSPNIPGVIKQPNSDEVIEYIGITEDEYNSKHGIHTLEYPYANTNLAVVVENGKDDDFTLTTWKWEMSTDGGSTWTELVTSSSTSKTLTYGKFNTSSSQNGKQLTINLGLNEIQREYHEAQFRLFVQNAAGDVTANPIPLTVYWLADVES